MRVSVTAQPPPEWSGSAAAPSCLRHAEARVAGDLAPELALPWVVKLRYGMALGQLAMILLAHNVFGVPLPLALLLIPIVVTLATNAVLARTAASVRNPRWWLGVVFCLDTFCLTVLLGLTGGAANPFTLLYLVQITLSALILNRFWTWSLGALSTLGFALLFWAYRPLPFLELAHHGQAQPAHLRGMFVAFAIGAALITFFIGKVSEALRKAEQEMKGFEEQVARQDRLASLVTLAAGAAHELATPMATIAVVAKELERRARQRGDDPGLVEDARLVRSEVERCRLILQQMSARDADIEGEELVEVAPADLLADAGREFAESERGRIRISAADDLPAVWLPRVTVARALAALIKNALEADAEGAIWIRGEQTGSGVRITIEDHGRGMTPEELKRIAEPFFTTKEPGRGMGLGIFLVCLTAKRLGGTLVFDSEAGSGTCATLELPAPARKALAHVES